MKNMKTTIKIEAREMPSKPKEALIALDGYRGVEFTVSEMVDFEVMESLYNDFIAIYPECSYWDATITFSSDKEWESAISVRT